MILNDNMRLNVEIDRIGNENIGTKEWKIGSLDVFFQSINASIPFVVAHGTSIETDFVHQVYHRIIDRIVLIVYRIARAVVAC